MTIQSADFDWWFVCCVSAGKDMVFRRDLARKGILNFSPIIIKKMKSQRRTIRKLTKPLFPGYVFVIGEQYKEFKKVDSWKGFVCVINSDENEPYHLSNNIVQNLIINQANGVYDLTKSDQSNISVGDIVDVMEVDESENILFGGGRVLVLGSKKATIICGNKVWKIKLCRIRKSAHKSHPFGLA